MSKWKERLLPSLPVFAVAFAVGLAGLAIRNSYPTVTAWLPAGVAIGATLVYGLRALPGVFLGIFALDAAWTGNVGPALLSAATGTAAVIVTHVLREKFARLDTRLGTVRDVSVLALAGAVPFGLATALLSAATFEPEHARRPTARHLQMPPHHAAPAQAVHGESPAAHGVDTGMQPGHAPAPSRAGEAFGVLLDDALGILLIAPAIFLLRHRRSVAPQLRAENPAAALTVLAVLACVTLSVYSGYLESQFGFRHATLVVLPPAVWLALQHGLAYTVAGNLLVYFITTLGTAMGYGPFNDHTSGLPMLLAIYTLTTLLVAGGRAERRTAEERIRHLATRDVLTNLPNRGLLATQLDLALSSARRQARSVAVLFIDLDHFKRINDSLGHEAGDAVLGIAAERITACLRAGSTVARFGGDEFIALVEWLTGPEGASHAAERIAQSLVQPFEFESHQITLSCSIGISLFPDDARSGPDLIKCADVAMYEAKKAGRSTFRFYSSWPGLLPQHAR